ncbi:MAG TPA: hypothetical protein VL404_02465 [Candidatus Eisenbacteria bacterium]|nr:hypothetical protein [Candidatus Eisenbacteria bacterium]
MPKISEGLLQKFAIAMLLVAFATVVWVSQANKRYFYAIVYGERSIESRRASIAIVTRTPAKKAADEAVADDSKLLTRWGWKVVSIEASRAEEYQDAFGAMFAGRPTKSPYLSFRDAKGRPGRIFFFDAPPSTLEEYRVKLANDGLKDVKVVGSAQPAKVFMPRDASAKT